MTNLDLFIKKTGLKLLSSTTLWNFHDTNIDNCALNPISNINKALKGIKTTNRNVTLYVDNIGRSSHSSSRVRIFEGAVKWQDELDMGVHRIAVVDLHRNEFKAA